MKTNNKITIKEILYSGIYSTLIMDIGEEFVKALFPVKESMAPQYLGRWILNMFNGVFIHDNIHTAIQFGFEIPVAILFHYFTGIFLVGIFLWLRNNVKIFPSSIYMGLVYGWVTILLPWLIMFPAFGFGFFGLGAHNDINNIIANIIAHSFFGLGITLWLGFVRKFVIKEKNTPHNVT
jgi:fluoride ion exporter CrcB/FEX